MVLQIRNKWAFLWNNIACLCKYTRGHFTRNVFVLVKTKLEECLCNQPKNNNNNNNNTGYAEHITKKKVSHLLYMDDLKLIGKTEEKLQKQMQVIRNFSDDIHIEFGLDKCTKIVFKRGKLVHSQNLILDFNTEIQEFAQGKT